MPQPHALVIDDNRHNVLVLEQLLSVEKVTFTKLVDTENLAAKLNDLRSIDIVFLDLELPHINGYEALKIIKAHPNFVKIPVIAYTVHVSEVDVAAARGFDGFIGKPVNAEMFPEQLRRILQGEKVWYTP
jgi:two-component system, cell cycle response regulator DivK